MKVNSQKPIEDIQLDLGERLRQLRIRKGLTQADLAGKANAAMTAVTRLERGRNVTLDTLIRVLRALGCEDDLLSVAPMPTVSPMAMLRGTKHPRRASRKRGN